MNDHHNNVPLQLECTLYFEKNPYAYETIEGLALRLGREPSDLSPIVQHLVSLDIIEALGEGDSAIYHYNQPKIASEVDLSWEQV
ncbi:hypothetical protein NC797_15305 [Aquibacillus sp. 3ASR75-11]|uniref:Uncharacterized protein n=1 Tax=Terrihalobacillus insolitus TaxID=2950438 RepID=A0A9X4APT6_9BACI|nr:hypothetical protein [Terrihalobacillus insolitus]MDC3414990.1 hypothetical protein [Terrihalobacillus insolitus]MDC3425875.1 hypothetical protein [Terrihalobacillus insolitus]